MMRDPNNNSAQCRAKCLALVRYPVGTTFPALMQHVKHLKLSFATGQSKKILRTNKKIKLKITKVKKKLFS
jgi:hypothetical protein